MKQCYVDKDTRSIADLSPDEEGWQINRINVPTVHRGNGVGSKLLKRILEDADAEGATLWLLPSATGGLTQAQLVAWYLRYGFAWKGAAGRSALQRVGRRDR
jgi:predicted GNAT family acetyltransferase